MKYKLYRSFGDLDKDVKKHELVAVEYGSTIEDVEDALIKDVADDLAEDLIRAGHAEEAQPNEVKRADSGSGKAARQKRT